MTKTINRAYLTEIIYHQIGISYAESANLVDLVFDELMNNLIKDKVAKISSFGSFYVKEKAARVGRNPKTRKDVLIKPRNVVSFYASSLLKEKIN
jgi:integration host factor subunit alpha